MSMMTGEVWQQSRGIELRITSSYMEDAKWVSQSWDEALTPPSHPSGVLLHPAGPPTLWKTPCPPQNSATNRKPGVQLSKPVGGTFHLNPNKFTGQEGWVCAWLSPSDSSCLPPQQPESGEQGSRSWEQNISSSACLQIGAMLWTCELWGSFSPDYHSIIMELCDLQNTHLTWQQGLTDVQPGGILGEIKQNIFYKDYIDSW